MANEGPLINGVDLDQIGIVVKDLHAFTQELSRLFGIGPFRIFEWPLSGVDPHALTTGTMYTCYYSSTDAKYYCK